MRGNMDKISGLVGQKGLDAVEDLYAAAGERVGDTLASSSSSHSQPHDLADAVGRRSKSFATQVGRRVTRGESSVALASDTLRDEVLNSVIMAEASARDGIPGLGRALASARAGAEGRLGSWTRPPPPTSRCEGRRWSACDWKVRMERKYLRDAAAGEDRHAAEVRAIMNRDKQQSKIS